MQLNDVYQAAKKFCKEFSVSAHEQEIISKYVETGGGRANIDACLDMTCDMKKLAVVCKPVMAVLSQLQRDGEEFKAAYRFWEYLARHIDYEKKYHDTWSDFIYYYADIVSYGLSAKETLFFMAIKSDLRNQRPQQAYFYGSGWVNDPMLCSRKNTDALYEAAISVLYDDISFDRRLHQFFSVVWSSVIKARSMWLKSVDEIKALWKDLRFACGKIVSGYGYGQPMWTIRKAVEECYESYVLKIMKVYGKDYDLLIADGENVFTYSEQMAIFNEFSNNQIRDTFKAIIADDETRKKLYTKENIAAKTYNADLTFERFEEAYKRSSDTQMLFMGLCFSPCKKVNAFCNAEIDKRKSALEKEFRQYASAQTGMPKYNAALIAALYAKWDDEAGSCAFASPAEVEAYAAKQKFGSAKLLDKFDYSLPVYGRDGKTAVSQQVLKVFLDKYFSMKDIYRNRTCDAMVAHFDKKSFRQFLDAVFATWEASDFDNKLKAAVVPYIFYASNEKLYNLRKQCVAWCDAGRHVLSATVIRVIALNGSKYALMLVDGIANKFPYAKAKQTAKDAMAEAAEKYNIPVEVLADLIIPDCGFGKDGRRAFGNDLTLTLLPDGDVRINRGDKVLKSLPSDTDTETKKDFSALKKEVKTILKLQTVRFERALLFGRSWKYKDFERLYLTHPVMRLLTANLVFGCYTADGELLKAFRVGLDGRAENCEYDDVTLGSDDIIALVHPCDLSEEQAAAWLQYIADNEIKQPFAQMANKVCYPLKINEKEKYVDLCEYPFNCTHAQRIAKKYDMLKTETLDGGAFDGYYLEDKESGVGVEIDMDGLYFYVDPTDGENLIVRFYFTDRSKENEYAHPDQMPTRLVSSVLSSLAAMMPAIQFAKEGKLVKNTFKPYVSEGFDFGDESDEAANEPVQADEQVKPSVEEKLTEEKPAEQEPIKSQPETKKEASPTVKPQASGDADLKDYLEFV
nr:DUF4132 domain-containing protein [Clostridiales bacterium]